MRVSSEIQSGNARRPVSVNREIVEPDRAERCRFKDYRNFRVYTVKVGGWSAVVPVVYSKALLDVQAQ
jgi:hypothetical protein